MKKTYNINISGYPFVIDEDAYMMLDSYLKTLGQVCERTAQRETAADIELRIAEIFSEQRRTIISISDVEEVIGRMGQPEEIVDIEADTGAGPYASPGDPGGRNTRGVQSAPPCGAAPVQKRLYRDVDHRVLGGVCSGLAWYTGIDVVWVRLIMVALAFVSGSVMALIYIVLWIVVPPARSPYERMQMMGVDPSVSNVGKVVTGDYGPDDSCRYTGCQPAAAAANVGRVIVMILTVVGLLVAGALLLALSVAFIGCVIAECVLPVPEGQARLVLGCVIGGSLVAGIPLFLAFRGLLSVLTEQRYAPFTTLQRVFLAVPWILGAAACIVCGILLAHYY